MSLVQCSATAIDDASLCCHIAPGGAACVSHQLSILPSQGTRDSYLIILLHGDSRRRHIASLELLTRFASSTTQSRS
jgi:hypothetical protein